MKFTNLLVLAGLGGLLVSCNQGGIGSVKLNKDEAKYSYAIGQQIATNIKKQDEKQKMNLDKKAFVAGIKETLLDGKPRMSEEEMRGALRKMAEKRRAKDKQEAEENLKKGQAFLEEHKKKDKVKTTKSGLQYMVVESGKGRKPKATDAVRVHYKGTLVDGTEFDSSYKRKKPAEFKVKDVIPGWTEALQMMKVGSKYKLVIPPNLAYGPRKTQTIPANSVLVFDVELLDILKPEKKKKKSRRK